MNNGQTASHTIYHHSTERMVTEMRGEVRKVVCFNSETEGDLLKLAASLPNFSGFVKSQLRKMAAQRNTTQASVVQESTLQINTTQLDGK